MISHPALRAPLPSAFSRFLFDTLTLTFSLVFSFQHTRLTQGYPLVQQVTPRLSRQRSVRRFSRQEKRAKLPPTGSARISRPGRFARGALAQHDPVVERHLRRPQNVRTEREKGYNEEDALRAG
eukprot:6173381-Pleurochrysis_carterae.AAC.1